MYRVHHISSISEPTICIDGQKPVEEKKGSDHTFNQIGESEDCKYLCVGLEIDTIYYVRVNGVNELGEGYNSRPFFIRTANYDPNEGLNTLYVWGNNINSQLALKDEQITKDKKSYARNCMMVPVNNTAFNDSVVDVSSGNVTTLVTFYDKELQNTLIIQAGMTTMTKD